jgi:hypothetical protein
MTTEFYADYIKKTTFDKESHSVKGKFDTPSTEQITEAATDVKKKPASKTPKMEVPATEIPEEDLDEKGKGLWANIHAKRARGEKPNPPGHPDRPSAADLKRSQSEELHGDQQHGAVEEKKSLASLKNSSMLDGKDRIKNMVQKVKKPKPVEKQEEGILDAVSKVASKAVSGVKNMAAKRTATLTGKKPSYSEETEDSITEATFKVDVDGLPTMYIDGSSAGSIKAQLRKKFKDPKAVVNVERITSTEKKQELRAKMSEDQAAIDAYLKKGGTIKKLPPAHARSSSDLEKGISGRVSTDTLKTKGKVKSMEDVEQVDEISSELAGRAHSSARKQVDYKKTTPTTAKKSDQGTKALAYHQRKAVNPSHTGTSYKGSPGGTDVAAAYKSSSEPARKTSGKYIDKLKKQGIDVSEEDRVDEISNASKRSYVRVAARDVAHQGAKAERGVANNDREAIRAADRKRDNRLKGIDRATSGMRNEDAESVDELSRDTLGSYISKASDASKYKGIPIKKVDNRYSGVYKASKKIDKMRGHVEEGQVEESHEDQRRHLKKVGKGGSVSYSVSGKTMTGEYGGLKNKGGRSYAMVHHNTHSAMVPLPNIKHK